MASSQVHISFSLALIIAAHYLSDPTFSPLRFLPCFSQTGAGTIAPTQLASHTFPPPSIMPSFTGTQVALLPTYTPTGSLKTLPGPTFTAAPSATVGTGWNNAADNQPAYV